MTEIRKLLHTGVGQKHADCTKCELAGSCARAAIEGERPDDWEPGGLMIIGEGPGTVEVSQRRPFVGPSGRLLDALCENAGFERASCWVTNATMGLPPRLEQEVGKKGKKGLHEKFPLAVYSCLPRLEEEIKRAQPRVIITLGQAALTAAMGHEVHATRRVKFSCDYVLCDPETRKLTRQCIVCANGNCEWFQILSEEDPDADARALKERVEGKCPSCEQSIKNLRPRQMKCPQCNGLKTREESFVSFKNDLSLVGREGVAGAVFSAEDLPSRWDDFGVKYIIPTYHPSFCLRGAKDAGKYIAGQYAARACVDHLTKAHALLKRDAQFRASPIVATTPAQVGAWFATLPPFEEIDVACDIETNAMQGPWSPTKITCIGFAHASKVEALVVDTRHVNMHGHDALLDELHRVLVSHRIRKVFHHGAYDRLVILRLWGIEVEGVAGDTLLEHHALYPDEEQNLGFCAHELLDAPAWKGGSHKIEAGKTDDLSGYKSFEDLALYNARDTRSTALIDEIMRGPKGQHGRLERENVERVHKLDLAMAALGVKMEFAGLPISRERFQAIDAACLRKMDESLTEMRKLVGIPDLVPRGAPLLEVLFDPAGPIRLPVTERTDTGQPSMAKEVLTRLADHHPFIPQLLTWRKYEYALSHYVRGAGLEPLADGRIHPQWKVHGTVTGRMSSSPNFQNWPKGDGKDEYTNLRSAIVAPPGRMICGADFSQLEMRIMASLSGDPDLIQRCMDADEDDKLNPERDPHSYVAAMTFGAAFINAEPKKRKMLRDVAKRVVYGLNYGAGAATILAAIYDGGYDGPPLTTRLIESVIVAYFKAFPGVPRWRDKQVASSNAAREVRSPIIGRRRIFPLGEMDVTVAYNFPIQSGAADIMTTRLLILMDRLPDIDPSAVLIAQVHDAIYIECDEDRTAEVEHVIEDSLTTERALTPGSTPMPYLASASHAKSWDKAA